MPGLMRGRAAQSRSSSYWARWTAVVGCLGALGYGGLKAIWAFGGTIGVSDPGRLRAATPSDNLWLVENMGTVALAALAALILVALVLPISAALPRRIVRTLGWLGTVMVVPGAAGLAEILDHIAGSHLLGGISLGGVAPVTYVFVYACFLMLGLGFAFTTYLTRRGRLLDTLNSRRGRRRPRWPSLTSPSARSARRRES